MLPRRSGLAHAAPDVSPPTPRLGIRVALAGRAGLRAPLPFMLLLMCFMPETPRFLLSQHKRQEAMAAMQFLWGSARAGKEPPTGAEHQVRAGSQHQGGTWKYHPRGQHSTAPQLHCVCAHTHTQGRELGTDVLWATTWLDQVLAILEPDPDLPVPARRARPYPRRIRVRT